MLAACTSGVPPAEAGRTLSTTASAPASQRSTDPMTPVPTQPTLDCKNSIGSPVTPAPLQVVLGVVALPTSPQHSALQTSRTGNDKWPRLFAKTGLLVKPGTTFDLVVPEGFASWLSIGWGYASATPTSKFSVAKCAGPSGAKWLAYPGGYWIDRPACVPLIVKAGGKEQLVHIGLGTACPGQSGPEGPNQT